MREKECDVLIIGAGPSGSTSAALVRKAGYSPLIVEKESFPRFVIGESLLPRCMDLLEQAGMLEAVRARGYMVKHGAVFRHNDKTCSFDFGSGFTQGWKYTYQVPRDDFDLTLAREVERQGVDILWNTTVGSVDFSGDRPVAIATGAGGEQLRVKAGFVLDASGYGRVLPRLLKLDLPSSLPVRQSIFTHVTGDIRPEGVEEGKIWICILPENSWLWIIPFSNGKTSVGIVARPGFIDSLPGQGLDEKLRAGFSLENNAAARLADARFSFPVKSIVGYSAGVKQFTGKGFALLGNATEFLDPVFSSGVTLALESANRAAGVLIRQLGGEDVDWDREYSDYMSSGVETFMTYVNGWYDEKLAAIFFSRNQPGSIRSQICSVLAGYVWDEDNPCVRNHRRAVDNLALACAIQQK
jgi:flavin-dependent dehydrogenase